MKKTMTQITIKTTIALPLGMGFSSKTELYDITWKKSRRLHILRRAEDCEEVEIKNADGESSSLPDYIFKSPEKLEKAISNFVAGKATLSISNKTNH